MMGPATSSFPAAASGGIPPSEAEVMRTLLVAAGVPEAVIHPEDQSTSTATNISGAKPILERFGIGSVLIVSDAYHLPRASLIARRARTAGRYRITTAQGCTGPNLPVGRAAGSSGLPGRMARDRSKLTEGGLAGAAGFEPAACGFGIRCSTN
jgi:hypothetical protein